MSGERPYHAPHYDLGASPAGEARTLDVVLADEAMELGRGLSAIEPWLGYRATPEKLARFFTVEEPDCSRRVIRLAGAPVGMVAVRCPWLYGPYLQFLGLLPSAQRHGLGAAVLDWMASEAPAGTRNLWLCVTTTNTPAQSFYRGQGFVEVGTVASLAVDGIDELLMRRRLPPT